jgi:hypothetical protein
VFGDVTPKAKDIRHTLAMMPIRRFDTMLDELLSVEMTVQPGSSSAAAILREQSGLRAFRLSENVRNAAAQMACIGSPASKQVTYALMRQIAEGHPACNGGILYRSLV